ncbi:hypothetical protein QYE76_047103 [Lolium multiflorum]|uniref:Transposase (putative) gypsy type domain-containing protein n=1 Tax=Lolium multiflorum TaxID=4521 RepID=A0AAD8TN79_LOLMU|nr:hypothetical protein QYE76_047103 [Lolium multiflorum]
MGKKKGTTASSATASAARVGLDWSTSTISKLEENKMRTLGLISSAESDFIHPGSASRPRPPKGFTVMFAAFLFRGLSLPAHEFLRSLLFFYGIQLWQLTPNSILHLSIFITLCEAFLGIDPHWGLWRKIFYVKRHNGNDGPPVVGGVGFVVRKEVNYFNYPMKELVQGWRQKWFYLQDITISGRRSNLPPFEDVLAAVPKKSWQNTLTAEESTLADQLYEKVLDLKNAGGQTMFGTEVVSVFLKCRVQPVMSRVHQLWMYTGATDKSRISPTNLSEVDLRDEVRRLTCLSQKDNIVMTSARPPLDLKHLPSEASTVAQCYPPTPESGVAPEDDDASEETEDDQNILEDSDALDDEVPEDDAHPIYATVDAVVDFADQFTRLEAEKVQLHKAVKASADQVLEANKLAAEVQGENTCLKDELKKLKKKMKDDQEAQHKAFIEADEKEGALRESITNLLNTADMPVDRRSKLRVDSMCEYLAEVINGALHTVYSSFFFAFDDKDGTDDLNAGPPTISGMYYSYFLLAKLFRENLIRKSGDTSECRSYHLNLMYYYRPKNSWTIDGCDFLYCELSRSVRNRMTPNYAQYVQQLINAVVPSPNNKKDQLIKMEPFKIPQQGDKPEVPSMMPSQRRSKEMHDPAASSSSSIRPKRDASRFLASLW